MKKYFLIFALLFIPLFTFAYMSPGKPQGFVNDFANILTTSQVQTLESRLQALRQSTGADVVVVTIPSLGDETVEPYATKLFKEWGIGDKDKDRGLLILVAPNEREARIEVGYGLEGDVTDIQSGNIIRKEMAPAFQSGNYAHGIEQAIDAVSVIITNSPDAEQYSQPQQSLDFDYGILFFAIIILINVFARVLGKTKSWWLGGVIGAVIGGIVGLIWGFVMIGTVSVIVLTILGFLFDFIVSKRPPGSGHGGWPMIFGGGHGSGGGFGGFGGGMSGGGGASGRW